MSSTDAQASNTHTGETPRKVVAGYFLSLDGVAETPDQFITGWDDETDARGAELIASQDTVILGRRTYDEWVTFWPGSDIQPFASFINAAYEHRIVRTSSVSSRETVIGRSLK